MGKEGENRNIIEGVKVYLDEYSQAAAGRKNRGIFGIDDAAEGKAREFKLNLIREELEKHDRGWEGNRRSCPKCGKEQIYKGDLARKLKFDCGELELKRAYYVCPNCNESSFPLDEKLNLAPEMEQGRVREKLSLLATLVSYHQIPEVARIFLGNECHAASARRSLLKEAEIFDVECPKKELNPDGESTLYVEIDGFMCPTREQRKNAEDQGYREAKAVQAFLSRDCAEINPNRTTILDQLLEVQICSAKVFHSLFKDVYQRTHAHQAKQTVVIADGAKWIWKLCDRVLPRATQILDFAHAKQHLYRAATLIYGDLSEQLTPWVKEKEGWLLENRVDQIIDWLQLFIDDVPELKREIGYFKRNQKRMRYKDYRDRGLAIASGSIESAGKRLAQGRVKGAGMRWNVKDLNPLLMLRAALFDGRLRSHWFHQRNEEDLCFQKLTA
jgi:predicted RNA-binding Zn-ribbon protein involved in translation (DUF1610 family)